YPTPSATIEETKHKLRQIVGEAWFAVYSSTDLNNPRPSSVLDTSGFEHVFGGEWAEEVKDEGKSPALGMHNWFTFYHREQNNDMNFQYWGWRWTQFARVNGIRRVRGVRGE
ncbi:Endoribonuclease XendoU, partial [Aphelenchoides avenae]